MIKLKRIKFLGENMQENLGDFTMWKGFFFLKHTQTIREENTEKKM